MAGGKRHLSLPLNLDCSIVWGGGNKRTCDLPVTIVLLLKIAFSKIFSNQNLRPGVKAVYGIFQIFLVQMGIDFGSQN